VTKVANDVVVVAPGSQFPSRDPSTLEFTNDFGSPSSGYDHRGSAESDNLHLSRAMTPAQEKIINGKGSFRDSKCHSGC
jgi:hypothetical protein